MTSSGKTKMSKESNLSSDPSSSVFVPCQQNSNQVHSHNARMKTRSRYLPLTCRLYIRRRNRFHLYHFQHYHFPSCLIQVAPYTHAELTDR
ncbi:hypothetical protein BJ165DRAFT_1486849, partial [Panaeolus papilionaceus]